MKFCLDDGAALIDQPAPTRLGSNAEPTLHLPGPTQRIPEGRFTQPSTMTSVGFQPSPGAATPISPAETPRRSSALLWIIIALIIGGSGIAVALILTRGGLPENTTQSATPTPAVAPGALESTSPVVGSESKSSPAVAKPTVAEQSASTKNQTERPTPPPRPTPTITRDTGSEKPAPKTISGGVLNGKATYLAKPAYPAMARSANVSGTVTVQVLVSESGSVISAHAISGHPLLQSSAVSAARASRFSPTLLGGVPVKVSGVITYNFQMQ